MQGLSAVLLTSLPGSKYEASDFEYLEARCNADLGGRPHLTASDMRLAKTDSALRAVDSLVSADRLCVPLLCPELLHATGVAHA